MVNLFYEVRLIDDVHLKLKYNLSILCSKIKYDARNSIVGEYNYCSCTVACTPFTLLASLHH